MMFYIASNNWEVPEVGAIIVVAVAGILVCGGLLGIVVGIAKWWKK